MLEATFLFLFFRENKTRQMIHICQVLFSLKNTKKKDQIRMLSVALVINALRVNTAYELADFVDGGPDSSADISWEEEHVSAVASQIADRVQGLSLVSVPSLMRRVSSVMIQKHAG